jgi:hypothetical protein
VHENKDRTSTQAINGDKAEEHITILSYQPQLDAMK